METTFKNNYSKSKIMKHAHSIAKKQGVKFAEALKNAWFYAKRVATIARNEFNIKLRKAGLAPSANTVAVNCPNQGNFEPMIKRYASTIAR